MHQTRIPCLLMRGGTSKGAFFLAEDLPKGTALRDKVLLAAMGSPDIRQIDGLGGADTLTSKVAIVRRSAREDADIDYLFAQVSVDEPTVDYGQNCGNILSAVGPFAIERGLVQAEGETTDVRIFMQNTGQIALARIATPGGEVRYDGSLAIDGVPGSAEAVIINFQDIAGSSCGALLPTGQAIDYIDGIGVTCIDNGMPVVLIRATDLNCTGYENPARLDANQELKQRLESIRLQAGKKMNLGDVSQRSVPKMTLVSAPRHGGAINTRTFIPHRCHSSIGVFGAVSVAAACLTPGSIIENLASVTSNAEQQISVEHPSGEFSALLRIDHTKQGVSALQGCGLLRSARLIFDGYVCIPGAVWRGQV